MPNGAAGLALLGRVCRLTGRDSQAAAWFAAALRLDPLAWSAYEGLCALGEGARAEAAVAEGEAVVRQHMRLREALERQQRAAAAAAAQQQQQYDMGAEEPGQEEQQHQEEEGEDIEEDGEQGVEVPGTVLLERHQPHHQQPEEPQTATGRRLRSSGRGAAQQQQQHAAATPGVSNIFSAMSIDTPTQQHHHDHQNQQRRQQQQQHGSGNSSYAMAAPAAPASATRPDGSSGDAGTPFPLFPSLSGVPASAGSSGAGVSGGAAGSGGVGAGGGVGGGMVLFGSGGPSTAPAPGAGAAAAAAHVTPHALSIVTPSPGGALEAPPGVPPKAPGAGGGGGAGGAAGDATGLSTAPIGFAAFALPSTGPGVPGPAGRAAAAAAAAAPTTDRTPPAAARVRGAAAARRAGRAAGRLFQTAERSGVRESPSSTLRRSARLAAGPRHPRGGGGGGGVAGTPPDSAVPAPFATSAVAPQRGAEDRRRPRREGGAADGSAAPPPMARLTNSERLLAASGVATPLGGGGRAPGAAAGSTQHAGSFSFGAPPPQPMMAGAVAAGAAGAMGAAADAAVPTPVPTEAAAAALAAVLGPLRRALARLSAHDARGALEALAALPPAQAGSAEALCLAGRARAEAVDYAAAAAAFEAARRADPHRLDGAELHSTALWHLRRGAELAHLARAAVASDRLAPQAWVAAGNAFSLARDHGAAVACFRRALQVDPTFAYAATLAGELLRGGRVSGVSGLRVENSEGKGAQRAKRTRHSLHTPRKTLPLAPTVQTTGHEYLASEDLPAALAAYRNALRLDARAPNALYGVGQVFLREGKHGEALAHFQAAARQNPSSSVLACYCGVAARRMGGLKQALAHLGEAVRLDARNPLARFERAAALADLAHEAELAALAAGAGGGGGGQGGAGGSSGSGPVSRVARQRYQEALEELTALQGIVPREPSVLFALGRVHKRLGDAGAALRALSAALDLAPTSADAAAVKAAIDRLHAADDAEDEGM